MDADTQRAVMKRLLASVRGEVPIEPRADRLDTARYTDPAGLEAEQRALFRGHPVVVAQLSEVAEPGDVVAHRVGGVPILVLRDGEHIRVFVNACRHRGAPLLDEGKACGRKALTCPYHAWSYRLDGSLLHVYRREVFAALDEGALALRAVPHAVRHGFVWARLDGEGEPDIGAFLGEAIDRDLSAFGLDAHATAGEKTREVPANWKLIMDAFAEGYHLKSLHRQSLSRFFLENVVVDAFAPHTRQVGARKNLREVADDPTQWDVRKHTTVFYNLFPNTVLVFHPHWLSAMTLWPLAVDRTRVVHRMLAPEGVDPERLAQSFALIDGQVFEKEDLSIASRIQTTLGSGANEEMVLGGLEEGMRLFHAARDRALAG